jgi:hypothetical protein
MAHVVAHRCGAAGSLPQNLGRQAFERLPRVIGGVLEGMSRGIQQGGHSRYGTTQPGFVF